MLLRPPKRFWPFATLILLVFMFPALTSRAAQDDSDQVAVVNGTPISRSDFNREVLAVQQQLLSKGTFLNEAQQQEMHQEVLDKLINMELLYQEALEKGIKTDDAVVDREIKQLKTRFPSEEEFTDALGKANLTEAQLREQIKKNLTIKQYIEDQFRNKIVIPEEDIQEYYDQHPEAFNKPEQVKASHILIKVDPNAEPSAKEASLEKIEEVQKKVKSGEDFAALAKEFSEGPSGERGGDLGYFSRGRMVKPFEEAAFALEAGEISEIVETDFGYHLIKVTDKKPEHTLTYDEVKTDLADFLKKKQVEAQIGKHLEELKKEGEVERLLEPTPASAK